jgi:hypothetical protein
MDQDRVRVGGSQPVGIGIGVFSCIRTNTHEPDNYLFWYLGSVGEPSRQQTADP